MSSTIAGLEAGEPGLGAEPSDPAARSRWQASSRSVFEARAHLDAVGAHRDLGPWPLLSSRSQLDERLAQLDEILATAPDDQHDLIARLRDGNQLTLADTTEALQAAMETQGARRDWILANWPHVVEYAEISRAIETRTYGPELSDLRESLMRTSTSAELRGALERGEAWVDRALCSLVGRTATTVPRDVRQTLEDLADYRAAWGVETADPIGGPPTAAAQQAHLQSVVDGLPDVPRSADGFRASKDPVQRVPETPHEMEVGLW